MCVELTLSQRHCRSSSHVHHSEPMSEPNGMTNQNKIHFKTISRSHV